VAAVVAAKTVQEAMVDPAVEPLLVLLMPVKQPVQATRHLPVPHRAIPEQSVLAMAVVEAVVPDQQDPLVWVAAAQAQVATVAQVTPGSTELYTEPVVVGDLQQDRVALVVVLPHQVPATEEAIHCQ
jgi:hypothetical protein